MGWLDSVLSSAGIALAVVLVFAGFAVFSFFRGWVHPNSQVVNLLTIANSRTTDANARAEEWKEAYFKERDKNEILVGLVKQLSIVGDMTSRILKALPDPREENDHAP